MGHGLSTHVGALVVEGLDDWAATTVASAPAEFGSGDVVRLKDGRPRHALLFLSRGSRLGHGFSTHVGALIIEGLDDRAAPTVASAPAEFGRGDVVGVYV